MASDGEGRSSASGAHRVEISSSNRAVCNNSECKKAGIKIRRNEVRVGTWLQTDQFESWQWKHWGCTSAKIISNWWDKAGEDIDMIDGYETLPCDLQAKVKRAFEQGHVDDEDFNGDWQMNRREANRFRLTNTKKNQLKKAGEWDSEVEDAIDRVLTEKNVRRVAPDGVDLDAPTTKKAKGAATAKKASGSDNESAPDSPLVKKGKKREIKDVKDDDKNEIEDTQVSKKAKTTKKKPTKFDEEDADDDEASAPKTKAKNKVISKAKAQQKAKPANKSAEIVDPDDDTTDAYDEPKPKPKGRKKNIGTPAKDAQVDVAPKAKTTKGRKKK